MAHPDPAPQKRLLSKKRSRLYAHWLDGEWYKVAAPLEHGRLTRIAEGGLKLHALFGTRIALSDVQLTDSPMLATLFSNTEFRNYLQVDRDFLTLVSKPQDSAHRRFSSAISGFYRATQGTHWTTSLPVPVDVVLKFARSLVDIQDPDTEKLLRDNSLEHMRVIRDNPQYEIYLKGVLLGVCHFTKKKAGPLDSPTDNKQSYLDVIKDALNTRGGSGDAYGSLEAIYGSLNQIVKETENKTARSAINRHFSKSGEDPSQWTFEQKKIWRSVVHAWNSNVSHTVGASETIAPLPEAVFPIRGLITDTVGPSRMGESKSDSTEAAHLPPLLCDPDKLSWRKVSEIVERNHERQSALREAFRHGKSSEIVDAADKLVQGLSVELAPPSRGAWAWDLAERITGMTNFCSKLGSCLPEDLGGTAFELLDCASEAAITVVEAHKYSHVRREFAVLNTLREHQENLIAIYESSAGTS
ncbi:MAG TPA: hypothetical protein VG225_06030 [Terracidiphilus sp.]|jgi:hypothetical protein|nr:hypothetical protein [Terracidiphilus sp.]